jgi:acyl-CoA thioesterase I
MTLRTRLTLVGLVAFLGWAAWALFAPTYVANSPARSGPLIAFGDSLTQGVGSEGGRTYPDHLAELLGQPVVNRGRSGETAAEALRRLDNEVLAARPGVVFVCLGGNDLLQRRDPDETFAALESIVSRATDDGALVVLIGVEGLPLLSADFGSRYKALARQYGCVYVPDVLKGIISKSELMADRIHPNSQGYALFAERVARAVRPHLG